MPEIFDSDEEASVEADLTDPISEDYSNVESVRSANDESQASLPIEPSYYGGEDEDQLDFMFLACADWEKIVEDEKAQEDNLAKSVTGPRVSSFPATSQLKREVKANLKEMNEPVCGSFENYLGQCPADEQK